MVTKTRKMVLSSVMVGISVLLSIFKPFELPYGGGITIASMTPIILIGWCCGTKTGLMSGIVLSIIQMIFSGGVIGAAFLPGEDKMALYKAIFMCLLDYTFAFGVLGMSGIFKNKFKNEFRGIMIAALIVTTMRYIFHIVSGIVVWGSFAEQFFSQDGFRIGQTILSKYSRLGIVCMYSIIYNGLYMVPEIVITAIATPAVYKVLKGAKVI